MMRSTNLVYSKLKVRVSSISTEISAMEALGTLVPFSPISPTSERRTTTKRPFRLPPLPLTLSSPASLPFSVLPSQNSPPDTAKLASQLFSLPCESNTAQKAIFEELNSSPVGTPHKHAADSAVSVLRGPEVWRRCACRGCMQAVRPADSQQYIAAVPAIPLATFLKAPLKPPGASLAGKALEAESWLGKPPPCWSGMLWSMSKSSSIDACACSAVITFIPPLSTMAAMLLVLDLGACLWGLQCIRYGVKRRERD